MGETRAADGGSDKRRDRRIYRSELVFSFKNRGGYSIHLCFFLHAFLRLTHLQRSTFYRICPLLKLSSSPNTEAGFSTTNTHTHTHILHFSVTQHTHHTERRYVSRRLEKKQLRGRCHPGPTLRRRRTGLRRRWRLRGRLRGRPARRRRRRRPRWPRRHAWRRWSPARRRNGYAGRTAGRWWPPGWWWWRWPW